MIVKYMRKRGYQGEGEDQSLTLEKNYIVLGISFSLRKDAPMFQSIVLRRDSDSYPCVFDLKFFDIIDSLIPPNWEITYCSTAETYDLFPVEFGENFWERYHDSDPDTERIFDEVYRDIQGFHGIEVPETEPEKKPENPFDWSDKWLRDD